MCFFPMQLGKIDVNKNKRIVIKSSRNKDEKQRIY